MRHLPGVRPLDEAEARAVAGGRAIVAKRGDAIRQAVRTYADGRRDGEDRAGLLDALRQELAGTPPPV